MKTTRIFILRSSLFLFVTMLLGLTGGRVYAQSSDAPSASAQSSGAAVSAPIIKPVARITQAIDETRLAPMQSRVHPLARPEFDRGVVPDAQPINRMLLLLQRSPEQEAALRELLDEQQTKNSPNYHNWLTPTTFGQQFGVAPEDLQKVTNWLAQKGFTGIKAGPDNMFVEFNGTAGLVRNAFHTEIHQFMVKGEMHWSNVSVPQIPAALAPVVATVHSLHNFRKKSFMHYSQALLQAKAAGQLAKPDLGDGNGLVAVAPGDFAKIYNLPPGITGSGQTIALVARSNITQSDITQFGSIFGIANLTAFTYANNVIVTGSDPGVSPPDDGEATLDIEMSGTFAPGANIKLVVSDGSATDGTDGVDYSAFYIVENNVAKIMSESFGLCEAADDDAFELDLWEFGAAEGISIFVSSGDNASAGCDPDVFPNASSDGLQVSGTASTPFNVAVGGTDFNDASNLGTYWNNTAALETAKSYIPEIPWNGSCASTATAGNLTACASNDPNNTNPAIAQQGLIGGGGGQSNCGTVNASNNCAPYPKPTWQAGVGVPADSARDLPDVSLFGAVNTASGHFIVMCLADSASQNGLGCNPTSQTVNGIPPFTFTGVGGTSASSPSYAGIMALVNQNEVTAGRLAASAGQGNPNYVFYKLAAAQNTAPGPGTSACNSSSGIPNTACTFHDVTLGNNSAACVGSWSAGVDGTNGFGNTTNPNCSNQALNGNGVLIEPSSPTPFTATTPAWTATAGYDLATGLGSANVTNLVNNWHTITTNFTPSTTTVTSTSPSPVTIGHGANVTFNVKVTGAGGTPSGDVSLIAQPAGGPAFGLNGGTLTGGTVSISTLQLPGGTYNVDVHYAGDGIYAPSDATVSVTVSKENSATATTLFENYFLNASGQIVPVTSTPYGSLYLFRVDVIGSQNGDNQTCDSATNAIPCPTGTITLTADGSPLNDFLNTATGVSTNTATLNVQGFVEDRVLGSTGLKGGTHSIVATYGGDSSYNASTAPALAVTITPASTQTSVTVNGSTTASVTTGQSVTLTANVVTLTPLPGGGAVASNGAGPTGQVTFSACGTAGSCTVTVVPTAFNNTNAGAFATATLNTTFATAGTQNITATFTTGDTNYNSCTTAVNTATQICTLTPLALTVTGTTTGSVAVSESPLTLSSATGASVGSTITVTPSGGFTGNVVVTASTLPPGVTCPNSPLTINVTAANPVQQMLNCQVTASSTTLMAANFGDSFRNNNGMLEAKAIPPTTGNVGGKGWWALSAGTGFAALFLFFVPGGRKRLHAALGLGLVCLLTLTLGCNGVGSGGGGGGLTATTTQMAVNADKEPSGTGFTFNVTVTGGTPTGTAQLFSGATAISTAGASAAISGGKATLTWNPGAAGVGTSSISVHYLGDATTQASQSGALNLTVTGPTQIAITTQPTATPAASPITVTIQ